MRVLGIDPGTIKSGYGVVDILHGQPHYVASGIITLGAGKDMPTRLTRLYDDMLAIIKKYEPTEFALEDLFLAKNVKSSLALAMARGVAMVAANQMGLTVYEYASRLVKSTVSGSGAAGKEAINLMVQRRLALPSAPQEDAADALAVALCHGYHCLQSS